jgi:transcriptional regulator with XRE-family HTH domain
MSTIGDRLRMAREQAGLSQGQVARLIDKHRPTISEIEAGRRKVSSEELTQFAKLYDVSLDWLAGGADVDDAEDVDRLKLAARELAKLDPSDLDRVLNLLRTLKRSKQ